MKKLMVLVILSSLPVLAGTTYVQGTGYSSGFCQSGAMGSFCIDQLQQQADQNAQQQAQMQCEEQQGTVEFGGNCTHFCNPPFINTPAGGAPADQVVSCNSNCNFECNTPN